MYGLQASLNFCFCITKSLQETLGVLVSQGYHKKVPHTGWLLNNRNVFSHSDEDYKSKIQASTGLAPSEGSEGKNLSHSSLQLLVVTNSHWNSLALDVSLQLMPSSSHVILLVSLSSHSNLLINRPVMLDQDSTPHKYHLILNN